MAGPVMGAYILYSVGVAAKILKDRDEVDSAQRQGISPLHDPDTVEIPCL